MSTTTCNTLNLKGCLLRNRFLGSAECLPVYHLWIPQSICRGGGWARGWSARLRGDTPSKGPQWGSFVQLLSRVHPQTPKSHLSLQLESGGCWRRWGLGVLWSAWLIGYAELKLKRVTVIWPHVSKSASELQLTNSREFVKDPSPPKVITAGWLKNYL